jgi:hypothetical protein
MALLNLALRLRVFTNHLTHNFRTKSIERSAATRLEATNTLDRGLALGSGLGFGLGLKPSLANGDMDKKYENLLRGRVRYAELHYSSIEYSSRLQMLPLEV